MLDLSSDLGGDGVLGEADNRREGTWATTDFIVPEECRKVGSDRLLLDTSVRVRLLIVVTGVKPELVWTNAAVQTNRSREMEARRLLMINDCIFYAQPADGPCEQLFL